MDKNIHSENSTTSFSQDGDDRIISVLLVDDERDYLNVLANRMKRRKIDATKAFTGTSAIQLLRKKDFDVAVVDLKMQDIYGIEVLKVFKKMAPSMPVIMLTGHGSAEAAKEGIKEGAFDYLMKPCELEELIGKIRKAAASRESVKDLPQTKEPEA
jgi:DNA-binding NtrC family response regulator